MQTHDAESQPLSITYLQAPRRCAAAPVSDCVCMAPAAHSVHFAANGRLTAQTCSAACWTACMHGATLRLPLRRQQPSRHSEPGHAFRCRHGATSWLLWGMLRRCSRAHTRQRKLPVWHQHRAVEASAALRHRGAAGAAVRERPLGCAHILRPRAQRLRRAGLSPVRRLRWRALVRGLAALAP